MADAPADSSVDSQLFQQLEERIADMEMRIAFQDDLMSTLDDQIANQEQALQRLWEANRMLRDQVRNLREPQMQEGGEESPPPHY